MRRVAPRRPPCVQPPTPRAAPRRCKATDSAANASTPAADFGRTFRTALSELLRHDAQAELKEGSYLITPSHRPTLPPRLMHEVLPLHESLLRRLCQVPTWYLYGYKKSATMFPLVSSDPQGVLTLPLFTQKPMPLPQTPASEIMELTMPALIGNLPAIHKTQPRLKSLSVEPRNFDFRSCVHLSMATAETDLSTVFSVLQFEETVAVDQPAVPRRLPLWTLQKDGNFYATQLLPEFTASSTPDPLLGHLASEAAKEPAKPTEQSEQKDLTKLGPHAHAFTFEGRALQFALKHKLLGTHRLVRLPAESVFNQAKEQKQTGLYLHLSNGGVALTIA